MKIMFVFGTRPEVIKLAPVILQAQKKGHEVFTVAVEQHKGILNSALRDFNIKPSWRLRIARDTSSLHAVSAAILRDLPSYLFMRKPEWIIVQGDTLTSFIAGFIGYLEKIKICHVEAGLRTRNLSHPFPEEAMRQLTARIATIHACPTFNAIKELETENIQGKAFVAGNTVVDSVNIFKNIVKDKQNHVLLTLHRRENDNKAIQRIMNGIKHFCKNSPEYEITFPCHPNPRIREAVKPLKDFHQIKVIEPVGYSECLSLIQKSKFVVTDSGGIQEEAGILGVPAIVCRETTERMESIEAGASILVGSDTEKLLSAMSKMKDDISRKKFETVVREYGDGKASERIIEKLESYNE